MIFQCPINRTVHISGIGLHTGKTITLALRPAAAGTGIVFHRTEGSRVVTIEAISANVVDTRLATVLGKDGLSVSTVEHLLAAVSALGIDNLHIDIDGPEVPVLDGSAAPFVHHLQTAGLRRLSQHRKFLQIYKPLMVVDGDKWVRLIPSRFLRITCDIAFNHPCIATQSRTFKATPDLFVREIAAARTFGFLHEVEYLKANGLARGGSLENAVVIGEDRILNPEGLRYPDEFVRHKILDALGDFSLTGYPILGHIKANKPGHDLNHRMVETLLASPDCWRIVELPGRSEISRPLSGLSPDLALSRA
jgi:UDP-3-O-[3-hydroxymyristoyl] N-acetylglucosamine deacetylase